MFDVEPLQLRHIAAVASGGELDESVLAISGQLRKRFDCRAILHRHNSVSQGEASRLASEHFHGLTSESFRDARRLAEDLNRDACQLVVLPLGEAAAGVDLDELVRHSSAPVLIVRRPVADPLAIFDSVLHVMTGDLARIANMGYSFGLVNSGGRLTLQHSISEAELEDTRRLIKGERDEGSENPAQLVSELQRYAERYLEGIVEAHRSEPYAVSYRLAVGDALERARQGIAECHASLLITGTHLRGESFVDAEEYRLMHSVSEIPVLAL